MSQKTLIQQAKKILSDIPDDKWCILQMYEKRSGKSCAMGLLNKAFNGDPFKNSNTTEAIAEHILSYTSKPSSGCSSTASIVGINDGNAMSYTPYKEQTPKTRVIHLLSDMVKVGY